MRRIALAVVLLIGCGPSRPPLPPPAADRSWVSALPVPATRAAPLRPPELPSIDRFQLSNGLTIELVEQRATPVVYLALVGRGGQGGARPPVELDALLERALDERSEADNPIRRPTTAPRST